MSELENRQLSERLAFLGIMGGQLRAPLNSLGQSLRCRIEGVKVALYWSPIMPRDADVIFSLLVVCLIHEIDAAYFSKSSLCIFEVEKKRGLVSLEPVLVRLSFHSS